MLKSIMAALLLWAGTLSAAAQGAMPADALKRSNQPDAQVAPPGT